MRRVVSVRRRRGQRGAVAVEAALITPVLIFLVFGMIDFGMLFKDYLAVTSATRAGARIASAEPRQAAFAQDAADQVLLEGSALNASDITAVWVYKAGTNGYPSGRSDFASCSTCVKFKPLLVSGVWTMKQQSSSWSATSQNACAGDVNRDSIGVYVKYAHDATVGLFFDTFDLQDHTVMSLEPVTATAGCRPPP